MHDYIGFRGTVLLDNPHGFAIENGKFLPLSSGHHGEHDFRRPSYPKDCRLQAHLPVLGRQRWRGGFWSGHERIEMSLFKPGLLEEPKVVSKLLFHLKIDHNSGGVQPWSLSVKLFKLRRNLSLRMSPPLKPNQMMTPLSSHKMKAEWRFSISSLVFLRLRRRRFQSAQLVVDQ